MTLPWPYLEAETALDDEAMARAVAVAAVSREYDREGNAVDSTNATRTLGDVVRSARIRKGLTRAALAARAGLHPAFIVVLENGQATAAEATEAVEARLAQGLGIKLVDLSEIVEASLRNARRSGPLEKVKEAAKRLSKKLDVHFEGGVAYFALPKGERGVREAALVRSLGSPSARATDAETGYSPWRVIPGLGVAVQIASLGAHGVGVIVTTAPGKDSRGGEPRQGWTVELVSGTRAYPGQATDMYGRAMFRNVEELDPKRTYIRVTKPPEAAAP